MSAALSFPLRLAGPGGAGGASAACPETIRAGLADDPAALLERGTVVKRSRRTLVARLSPEGPDADAAPLALKRYLSGTLRWRAGWGRAKRAAHRLAELHAAGVPVPEPLAWIEGPAGGFVVLPWLEGWAGADRRLAEARPAERRATVRALADCIGRLHRAGFAHRDLKAANLLCEASAVALVDVDGARRAPLGRPERRARDLHRLWRSLAALSPARTDCRRFMASYAQALGDVAAADRVGGWLAAETQR